ncbi:MAG: flagellar hook assembly protein FlgD [Thermodesulfobacteriota bacterium]
MELSALSAITPSNEAMSQTKKNSLTQDDFLNLFVAQLKFQNPLEPLDNYQMATHLAQLGNLDSLKQMTEYLQYLAAVQASMGSLQASGLIGKKVEAAGNVLSIENGTVSEGSYQLSKPAKVTIHILDAQGSLVRTLDQGLKDTAPQKVVWNGKNQEGKKLPDGTYLFKISAKDGDGQSVSVHSKIAGMVTGISFENDITYLMLGSKKITLSDVTTITN